MNLVDINVDMKAILRKMDTFGLAGTQQESEIAAGRIDIDGGKLKWWLSRDLMGHKIINIGGELESWEDIEIIGLPPGIDVIRLQASGNWPKIHVGNTALQVDEPEDLTADKADLRTGSNSWVSVDWSVGSVSVTLDMTTNKKYAVVYGSGGFPTEIYFDYGKDGLIQYEPSQSKKKLTMLFSDLLIAVKGNEYKAFMDGADLYMMVGESDLDLEDMLFVVHETPVSNRGFMELLRFYGIPEPPSERSTQMSLGFGKDGKVYELHWKKDRWIKGSIVV